MIIPFVACIFAFKGLVADGASSSGSTPHQRAAAMLAKMNFTEKVRMMHGDMKGDYIGSIDQNDRLGKHFKPFDVFSVIYKISGIPAIKMQDGPQGFRVTSTTGEVGSTTAWPTALSASASWDTDLLYEYGSAMATEFKGKGANMQLGPGLGIARVPTAGRNFEYLCGEDPYFCSVVAAPVIRGIQGTVNDYHNNDIIE